MDMSHALPVRVTGIDSNIFLCILPDKNYGGTYYGFLSDGSVFKIDMHSPQPAWKQVATKCFEE